ncbi:hypothetical protein M758_11G162300 [Ceratodon purpureus]|nr:hypothetical protein M758_11G162300 [Ceratodon purpureus]
MTKTPLPLSLRLMLFLFTTTPSLSPSNSELNIHVHLNKRTACTPQNISILNQPYVKIHVSALHWMTSRTS